MSHARHRHEWVDVTRMGSRAREWICAWCPAQHTGTLPPDDEPPTCAYCGRAVVGRTGECVGCGAPVTGTDVPDAEGRSPAEVDIERLFADAMRKAEGTTVWG